MDDTVEIVLGVLLSVIVFFIFPIYVAYEKKDDLAYALATKYVSEFVEEVKVKGYISSDMYEKLENKLLTTGNTYDIFMEHRANKIYPSTSGEKFKEVQEIYTERQILASIYNYDAASKIYTPKEKGNINLYNTKISGISGVNAITSINMASMDLRPNVFYTIDSEGKTQYIYAMNIGDEFTIRIRNNNISIAASLFDSFTTNNIQVDTTRVYVNYGAIITSEKYW